MRTRNPHIEHLYKEGQDTLSLMQARIYSSIDKCETPECIEYRKKLDVWDEQSAKGLLERMEAIYARSATASIAHDIGARIRLVYSIILKFQHGLATYNDRELLGNVERGI